MNINSGHSPEGRGHTWVWVLYATCEKCKKCHSVQVSECLLPYDGEHICLVDGHKTWVKWNTREKGIVYVGDEEEIC